MWHCPVPEAPYVHLTLLLRRPQRLQGLPSDRVHVIEGDVLDRKALEAAMAGQDVIYANLAGPLEQMARSIVQAMHATGLRRLSEIIAIMKEVQVETL